MFFRQVEEWLASLVQWILGLVVLPPPPAFLGEGGQQLAMVLAQAHWLCNFVDFSVWPQALGVLILVYLAAFGIRLLRIVLGYFIG